MKKSTLETWKKLQKEGYFNKHPLYEMNFGFPHCVDYEHIKDKNVVEIGCGYGRESVFFNNYVNCMWAIDVTQDILEKAKTNLINSGSSYGTFFVLAENYKKEIPNNIDYVYALHVFQHLAPEQTKDYIDTMYKKLMVGGRFNAQFYIGTDKMMDEGKEPRVQYTKKEVLGLFENYKIEKTWLLNKFDAKNNLQYEHMYVIARKQ